MRLFLVAALLLVAGCGQKAETKPEPFDMAKLAPVADVPRLDWNSWESSRPQLETACGLGRFTTANVDPTTKHISSVTVLFAKTENKHVGVFVEVSGDKVYRVDIWARFLDQNGKEDRPLLYQAAPIFSAFDPIPGTDRRPLISDGINRTTPIEKGFAFASTNENSLVLTYLRLTTQD